MKVAALVSLVAFSVLGSAACKGGYASYPDASNVAQAQAAWCASLAKVIKDVDVAGCKSSTSTASAAFLKGMAKCFPQRLTELGDKAPDQNVLVSECTESVTVSMTADESQYGELIAAHCKRAAKCEKTTVDECKASISKLETAQRAKMTSMYNYGALHQIADCLESSSCKEDEGAAHDACYAPLAQKLLWFPG